MEATDSTSFISLLHEELLWGIFVENTYIGPLYPCMSIRHSPLTTAVHCSQVCRHWRSIFLSSSFIWGRLVDISYLQKKTEHWREELMTRTGEALLWVYGYRYLDARSFIFNLLKQNWQRVEVLVLMDSGFFFWESELEIRGIWSFLQEPAPQLKRIEIGDSRLPSFLFGDNAPLLKEFRIRSPLPSSYKFPTRASWLPNLTSLRFTGPSTIGELLTALQRIPRLVSLTVSTNDIDNSDPHPQGYKVDLPKLRMFDIYGDMRKVTTILQSITLSPYCSLSTSPVRNWTPAQLDNGEYEQYENALKSHVVPYFSLYPPSVVEFCMVQDTITLRDVSQSASSQHPPRSQLVLSLTFLPFSLLMKQLVDSGCLSNISKLELGGLKEDPSAIENLFSSAIISDLYDFSSTVTTLRMNDLMLRQLLACSLSFTSTLFPALTTLEIDRMGDRLESGLLMEGLDKGYQHNEFLKLRKAIGRPVAVFDLGILYAQVGDMGYLEEQHSGLLVKWETMDGHSGQYMCGEKHPERLNFPSLYVQEDGCLYRAASTIPSQY